jgi:Domain of unknown function (DUF3859)
MDAMSALFRTALLVAVLATGPVAAEPAAPVTAPGIVIEGAGIYCRTGTTLREEAPGTSLGYIQLFDSQPEFAFRQLQVPARLGVHFGVVVTANRDIAQVRNETWKPGAAQPEVWFADLQADAPKARGFSFDFPEELVTGTWRMMSFDGDTLLYAVEFEVVPGDTLPGVTSDCNLLS